MKKKQSLSSAFVWLKDVGLKAFAVLALVVGGFYVLAVDIVYPPTQPNPTTGVVGMFVGVTKNKFTSAQDYALINAWCETGTVTTSNGATSQDVTNQLAHVCTPDEMINSYNHASNSSIIKDAYWQSPTTQYVWINNGPPAFAFNANDCLGWKDITKKSSGAAWDLKAQFGFLNDCNEPPISFACCK